MPHLDVPGTPRDTGWRVSSPAPKGGRSRAAAATGNLGPGGAGRARPARAASLVAAPRARLGPAVRLAEPGLGPPGLAGRLSPWKRWVDSAVNINFPSSRQPRRRVSAPRPRSRLRGPPSPPSLERHAHSGARGSLRPSPTTEGAAAVSTTTQPLARPPAAASGSGPAASGKPKAQARQGLKETGRRYRIMGSSRLGAGLAEKRRSRNDWTVRKGAGKSRSLLCFFQSTSPRPYKLLTSPVS